MITNEVCFRKGTNCGFYKSLNDKKRYRFFRLENGLRVLIVQDVVNKPIDNDEQLNRNGVKRIRLDENVDVSMIGDSGDSGDKSVNEDEKMSGCSICVNRGSLCDPIDLQGLSHFLEHVIFMGNTEFPKNNELDEFLGDHSGHTNACTRLENVIYYAETPNSYLDGCLKRVSAMFKGPLFEPQFVESEISPVNNEFATRFLEDEVRSEHFLCSLAKKSHPLSKFAWGNQKSLVDLPKSKGIDVRSKMVEFYNQHYKADRMSVVVQSQESLDSVEKMVREYFKDVPTENALTLESNQFNEQELIQKLISNKDVFSNEDYPYEKETMSNHLYIMDAVEDHHSLKLVYIFPPVRSLFKLKPLSTLSSILGYEGKNSLTTFLVKKNLITECLVYGDGSGDYSTDYYSTFMMEFKLTDEGLEKVKDVVQYVNYYIDLMYKAGPQENHYEELRQIHLTNIRFQDETSVARNVEELAENLFLYPVEYAIIGPHILEGFSSDAVKYALEFLRFQPRISLVVSKKAFKSSNSEVQTEFFADIEYKVEPLPAEWSQVALETDELKSKLSLPDKNEFIASNFELKKQDIDYLEHPILIDEDTHYRCYFKNDKEFKTPKSCIFINWDSYDLRNVSEVLVSLKLFVKYFELYISEYLYPAQAANLEFSINVARKGFAIKLNGLNDKLFKLLKSLLDHLKEFKIDPIMFDTIKLEAIRDYYNYIISCNDLVLNLSGKLDFKNFCSYLEQRELLKQLDIDRIRENVKNFFKSAYCSCLIEGNYTKAEAKEIFDYVKQSTLLGLKENVDFAKISEVNVYQQPEGETHIYVRSLNRLDEHNVIYNSYQIGKLNDREAIMLELLMQMMFDPLFNNLRNQKGLAYNVYNKMNRTKNDVYSYQIFLKSLADKFTPMHIDEQIELFLDEFLSDNILQMKEEKFKDLKDGRIKSKQVPFQSLKKEANHNWNEICDYTYRFDRLKKEVDILKNLPMNEFILFAKNVLAKTAQRKKLSIHSIGNGDKTGELFTCLDNEKLEKLFGNEDDEEFNYDELNISLVHMRPKEPKDGCQLVEDIEKFISEKKCF